jgi:hypothetical protein
MYTEKKTTGEVYLDVIAVISNPAQYQRRYDLFEQFCLHMKEFPQVRLTTLELQQRARPFQTSAKIKLRTKHELWHKENMVNIAVTHLPSDWEYVAWIDADITFQNKNWVRDTIDALQTYAIVQLFSHAIDLGPKDETLQVHTGFCYLHVHNEPMNNYRPNTPYKNGHTGYGFACRKSAYNAMGGLLEFAILGSGDAHMCLAWIGKVQLSLNSKLNENYKRMCLNYEERCTEHIKQNIGYIPGTILHNFHGDKKYRKYKTRWSILLQNDFDPLRDIKKDHNNLWQMDTSKPRLRDAVRQYFRQRNEDSNEIHQNYKYFKSVN